MKERLQIQRERADGALERDYDSQRRKFKQPYSTRKPTNNPFIPPTVRTVKAIKTAIDARVGAVVFDGALDNNTDLLYDDEAVNES